MEKPHGYLHDIASVHVIACNATSENPAKHLQTRGVATEPSYLVLARVTLTVPVAAVVIQVSKGEFLSLPLSPPLPASLSISLYYRLHLI
jgi:hypothetical protein